MDLTAPASTDEPLALRLEKAAAAGPVRLTHAGRLSVTFEGQRGGDGPMTLGQANALQWVGNRENYTRMLEWTLDLPPGTGLGDIAAVLGILVARHESLRTTFPADGPARQRVARSGELHVGVYEAGEPPPASALVAAELARRLRLAEFDLTRDLPVRAAVAVSGGVPVALVMVYSHVATDFGGAALLDRQFGQLIADPAGRDVGPRSHQPLDQAQFEQTPVGRRRMKTAVGVWQSHLRSMPQALYSVPACRRLGATPASGWLTSPAAGLALPHIVARTGVSESIAVLAATCAVLAWRAGQDKCAISVSVSNRFQRATREYVGTLAADGALAVDITPGFDELLRRTSLAMVRCNRSGLLDRTEHQRAITEAEFVRGITYIRDTVFNDLTAYAPPSADTTSMAPPEQAREALARSDYAWIPTMPVEELLLVIVHQVRPDLVLGLLTRDSCHVTSAEMESLLHGIERLLAEAASGDVDLSRLGEVTGVAPVPRGPGWARIGSCWVELPEAQRLLDDALGVPAAVFFTTTAGGSQELVAYLAASDAVRTPEQAHAACAALLVGCGGAGPDRSLRHTAMAPARYVVCGGAPAFPSSLAGWQQQPVLAEGPGR